MLSSNLHLCHYSWSQLRLNCHASSVLLTFWLSVGRCSYYCATELLVITFDIVIFKTLKLSVDGLVTSLLFWDFYHFKFSVPFPSHVWSKSNDYQISFNKEKEQRKQSFENSAHCIYITMSFKMFWNEFKLFI